MHEWVHGIVELVCTVFLDAISSLGLLSWSVGLLIFLAIAIPLYCRLQECVLSGEDISYLAREAPQGSSLS